MGLVSRGRFRVQIWVWMDLARCMRVLERRSRSGTGAAWGEAKCSRSCRPGDSAWSAALKTAVALAGMAGECGADAGVGE